MVIVQYFGEIMPSISLTSDLLPGYGTFGGRLPLLGDLTNRNGDESRGMLKG